ncbi:acyltransferase [Sphingopyxis sp. KK2]|uniref:acyltransferase family protein n=1 Tax=Sphingopyxis sp. KK2 TaxID=1855727 RepID=UPI00097E60C0|nr:acyltransferase [Sphingopyxis sp. KK2]
MIAAPTNDHKVVNYYHGLDTIRLICAAIVAIGHHYSNFRIFESDRYNRLISSGWDILWNGPAAVIVFFIISGLVIHAPYHRGKAFDTGEFYVKRSIRIVIPSIVFMIAFVFPDIDRITEVGWKGTVLWSLICELIYYFLYPFLVRFNGRMHIPLAISCVVTLLIYYFYTDVFVENRNYRAFGYGTFLVGFPCWLAGCWLAENLHRFRRISDLRMNLMRVGIFALAVVFKLAKTQLVSLGIFTSAAFLLNIYAIFATIWLGFELMQMLDRTKPAMFDRMGLATFSLYLVHPVAMRWFDGGDHGILSLLLYFVVTAIMTYIFYLLCERPSHRLAHKLGNRLVGRAPTARRSASAGATID